MGKTRDFLTTLNNHIIDYEHKRNELIHNIGSNIQQHQLCKHKVAALEQKYQVKFDKLIKQHIEYLEEPDPYGRPPLLDAKVKKELFVNMNRQLQASVQKNLSKLNTDKGLGLGDTYISALRQEINKLERNPIIDQPRWAPLQLNHIFHFFKSMVSKSDDSPKQPSPPKKHK